MYIDFSHKECHLPTADDISRDKPEYGSIAKCETNGCNKGWIYVADDTIRHTRIGKWIPLTDVVQAYAMLTTAPTKIKELKREIEKLEERHDKMEASIYVVRSEYHELLARKRSVEEWLKFLKSQRIIRWFINV